MTTQTPDITAIFNSLDYGPAPESADPARAWIDQFRGKTKLYIGGEWREPSTGAYFDTINPANGKALTQVAAANSDDVNLAVEAARSGFEVWSKLSGYERARYMYAIARNIQKHSRLLAVLETLENGKSIRETRDLDIPLVARHFYHHAGWAQLMTTELPGYAPLGVIGQIIPWNFPLLMLAWKIAPALAMGNCVVLKPAEFTSLTALKFAEICAEIGLPPGVVNVITGDGATGAAIVAHPGVDKIAFTGSTEVGRIIRKQTAGSGKRLSLELGGKSPFVVFEDADLDSVVEGVVDAIWFNQGEVCCAGSRILAQENVYPRLIDKLKARMNTLRVGDPLDKAIDMGAVIDPIQLRKIADLVEQGKQEGAVCYQPPVNMPSNGFFFPPTLFTDVAPAATIAQVEIFGPVAVAMSFRTPAEAVQLANNTRYGLAASVWSDNLNLSLDVARQIKAGTVWINSTNLFDAASGFGGYRESGYGREGGKEGLYEYVRYSRAVKAQAAALNDENAAIVPISGLISNGVNGTQSTNAQRADRSMDRLIDQTPKLYIGGKQARPDAAYSVPIKDEHGQVIGQVGEGNRKDIRNAVEAAHAANSWAYTSGHTRAQVLYYIAENLNLRRGEFADRISKQISGQTGSRVGVSADQEVELSLQQVFTYAAWADKYDGAVHNTPLRGIVLALNEPIGVIGMCAPTQYPLLGLISIVAPAIAMGNTVIAVPSERYPLSATDLYQVLETSDLPGGVVNIVTGSRDSLMKTLAEHDDVDSIWYFGSPDGVKMIESASVTNMKRTWAHDESSFDWITPALDHEFLRESTQVKNIWTPYGE